MNVFLKTHKDTDFNEFGYETRLRCHDDEECAKHICAQRIQRHELKLQPQLGTLESEIQQNSRRATSLHEHLYDRPTPVDDAAMLARSKKIRNLSVLAALASLACFAGNTTTFYLFGFGLLLTLVLSLGATGLPVVVGHLAYEQIVEKHKTLQNVIIAVAAILCLAALAELGLARATMTDKAAAETSSPADPYVGGSPAPDSTDQDTKAGAATESKVRGTFGTASLLIMIAADLMLGFLVGRRAKLLTDEDYTAWRELYKVTQLITGLKERVSHLLSSIEIAKKECTEGILRAQVELKQRRTPYHGPVAALALFALLAAVPAQSQTIERYEGILIDTSGSISRNGVTNELFRQYLVSTKRLLITETPSTRVWVSSIAVDSFGGDGTLLKGWTPESRGIFTDDLNRARRELASAFEQKSSRAFPGGRWDRHFRCVVAFQHFIRVRRKLRQGTVQNDLDFL